MAMVMIVINIIVIVLKVPAFGSQQVVRVLVSDPEYIKCLDCHSCIQEQSYTDELNNPRDWRYKRTQVSSGPAHIIRVINTIVIIRNNVLQVSGWVRRKRKRRK